MKWEYLVWDVAALDHLGRQDRFNFLGSVGWELVIVEAHLAYFKRAV